MVKCVVTGCSNRSLSARKRFFRFPTDGERVKVWLAALREADRHHDDEEDGEEQRFICEDHFLPEHLCEGGVTADAIPIMPHCMDGLGMISPWEEEDEGQGEGPGEEEPGEGEGSVANDSPPGIMEPPSPSQRKDAMEHSSSQDEALRPHPPQRTDVSSSSSLKTDRKDVSLLTLTRHFVRLMRASPDGSLDLRRAVDSLHTSRRRVCDITNVLSAVRLVRRTSPRNIKWTGSVPVDDFLWWSRSRAECESLRLMEEELDSLIRKCAQQLFSMTDDTDNASLAYVTHGDLSRLSVFQDQTLLLVKAPEETKLEVPPPTQDGIQIHLKGGRGPIVVVTCDLGSKPTTTETNGGFETLEGSRIDRLHNDSSRPSS